MKMNEMIQDEAVLISGFSFRCRDGSDCGFLFVRHTPTKEGLTLYEYAMRRFFFQNMEKEQKRAFVPFVNLLRPACFACSTVVTASLLLFSCFPYNAIFGHNLLIQCGKLVR